MPATIKDPIVWIDCEMTGLDLSRDALIEVAVVVTDSELRPVDAGIDLVVAPPAGAVEQMGDVVREMHTTSGLLEELDAGLTMADAQEQVLAYVRRWVPEPRKAPLAGNSVGTDRTFLERDMPQLVEHLHYRIIDVSSIKELARRWYPRAYFHSPQKHGGHRALADILESIDELRYYRAVLWPQGEGPDTPTVKAAAEAVTSSPTAAEVATLAAKAAERSGETRITAP
ncbi:oligoribonuclease [Georgenia satyanarayanai]|uniref:Oligoribonuclease n=2 Tax=Georgenia satyanarayanai TaxID=860221 RepID=A0A2Y9ADR2_9MICO|nr:oligoribonuclease [Georgenia satyanarayanai]PYG00201.1 oligoribonuclease [Georgenia satyanarayanai]SSA40447.1 oligoribonuclease [Georgenia satyanarayanai]